MTDLNSLMKAYDVRGVVPDQLNASLAHSIGMAFAQVIVIPEDDGSRDRPTIAIGYDMRPSSPELVEAFARGACSQGVDVIVIGLCSTDGLYHASGALGVPGAMFTASHNPARYNGIKMCRKMAKPIGEGSGLELIRERTRVILEQSDDSSSGEPGTLSEHNMLPEYSSAMRSLVDLSSIRPLKVVVDAGNGMAGLTVPSVLETAAGLPPLPLTIEPMYFELDGSFPNHEANPLDPANLVDLQREVVARKADIGLAFDGDADRCFVVDELGQLVSPSAITALVATEFIAQEKAAGKQATIVYNLISSKIVPETIASLGALGVRARVGHSFMKALMAEHQAIFGGEHSGHFYFKDFFFADTGMLAALHVLKTLGTQDLPLSQLVAPLQPYSVSGEINSTVTDPAQIMSTIEATYSADSANTIDHLDGLTIDHWDSEPRWWFNVRSSNTEPLLRLNVEAAETSVMESVRDEVLGIISAGTNRNP